MIIRRNKIKEDKGKVEEWYILRQRVQGDEKVKGMRKSKILNFKFFLNKKDKKNINNLMIWRISSYFNVE